VANPSALLQRALVQSAHKTKATNQSLLNFKFIVTTFESQQKTEGRPIHQERKSQMKKNCATSISQIKKDCDISEQSTPILGKKKQKAQIVSVPGISPKERDRYRVLLGDEILGDRLTMDEAIALANQSTL
jgi:hypothetical protein